MKLREKLVKIGFAFFFILLTSYVISEWTVDSKYIKYSDEQQVYLNSEQTISTVERSVEDILRLRRGLSIEFSLTEGSLIDATTEPVSGDLDVDIFLLLSINTTSDEVLAHSMNIGSSREHLAVESTIETPSIDKRIFTRYPHAELVIIPVTGSGIISIRYATLHPVQELIYLCVVILVLGACFFFKSMFDLIEFKRS